MRSGVAKTVTRVGKTTWRRCCHGIGYLLARSVLYEALAILSAAYPSDVILVNHTQSIALCAARGSLRIVLPIRRSVRTMRWSTPNVGRTAMCVARKGFA